MLRYWLRYARVNPNRDIVMRVLSLSLMTEAMRAGEIDGFIAGSRGAALRCPKGWAHLRAHGVTVRVCPGITAASAAAVSAGVSLSLRGHARRVQLITADDAPGRSWRSTGRRSPIPARRWTSIWGATPRRTWRAN